MYIAVSSLTRTAFDGDFAANPPDLFCRNEAEPAWINSFSRAANAGGSQVHSTAMSPAVALTKT